MSLARVSAGWADGRGFLAAGITLLERPVAAAALALLARRSLRRGAAAL